MPVPDAPGQVLNRRERSAGEHLDRPRATPLNGTGPLADRRHGAVPSQTTSRTGVGSNPLQGLLI